MQTSRANVLFRNHKYFYRFENETDEHELVTRQWLEKHGFKYHNLLLNKPRGGNYHWIDNHTVRATRYNGVWNDLVKAEKIVEIFPE